MNFFLILMIFSLQPSTPEMKQHLENCLALVSHFRSLMEFNPKIKYPPIATLISKKHPTLRHIMKDGPKSVNGYDFESMPKVEGDGRVTYESSKPPEGRHTSILLDFWSSATRPKIKQNACAPCIHSLLRHRIYRV